MAKDYYLAHHGILGQKWGIRRFQNKDGSYTAEGKRRRKESDDYSEYKELKKKKNKQMSNTEMRKFNERARLEEEYKRLHPNTIQKGLKIVRATSLAMLTVVQFYNNSQQFIAIGKKILKKEGN